MSARRRRQSGSVLVLVAALSLILVAFVGLVIDGGQVTSQSRTAQNAADGAALAAGYSILNDVPLISTATTAAQTVALANGVPAAELTLTFTDSTGAVTSSATQVNYVQAAVSHTFPNLFLPIMDLNTATVTASAKVRVKQATYACDICVLSPTGAGAFRVANSFAPSFSNAKIGVNSTDPAAAQFGNGVFTDGGTGSIKVAGNYTVAAGGTVTPTPTPNAGAAADQFPSLAYPSLTSPSFGAFTATGGGTQTIQPGLYSTIDIGSGTVIFAPGVYVVTGYISVTGSATVLMTNVMVFFACSAYPTPCAPGQAGAYFNFNSSGNMDAWSAPTTGTYANMALFYDRNNASPLTINGSGSSDIDVIGTIYAASAAATVGGPDVELDSMIVVNTLSLTGPSFQNEVTYSENYSTPNSLTLIV